LAGVRRSTRVGAALVLAGWLVALVAVTGAANAQAPTELQSKVDELEGVQSAQGDVAAAIERHNAEVNALIAREAEVRDREDAVAEELSAAQARLDEATAEVKRERAHLAEVRERLSRARELLGATLVAIYKSPQPDTLSVILESSSWSDVLAQAEYVDRVHEYDEDVIARVEELAAEVEATVERLRAARERIEDERDTVAERRDEVAAARREIESRHAELVAARAERREALRALESRERKLQKQIEPSAAPPGGGTAKLVDGLAVAPSSAPPAVKSAIEAANRIVGRPYTWGGGHGSFEDSGYDCSGAVSYALHGGGFLSSPLDSTGLTTWGSPGAGSWITVYANSGHTYAVIAGLRFDTSGTVGGSGPSWSAEMRSSAGFVARHPDGY
jgi:peptidoglycan hydrolase CwlO-like protein